MSSKTLNPAHYFNRESFRKLTTMNIPKMTLAQVDLYIDLMKHYLAIFARAPKTQLKKVGFLTNIDHFTTVAETYIRKAAAHRNKLWQQQYNLPGQTALFGVNTNRFSPIKEVDRKQITTQPHIFQGREDAFAKETVDKIVREGFDKSQDPIVVWFDDKAKKYVVISGHSRFHASEVLFEKGDKTLAKMPVKVFLGDKDEAQEYALLESNRSGTQESFKSDLKAFKIAKEKGYNKAQLLSIFKPESKLRLLQDLSLLNPNGQFVQYIGSDDEKHFPYLQRNAQWVAQLRKAYPALSDAHEKEMFDFLYKSKQGLAIRKDNFNNLIEKKVANITFDPQKPLNLANTPSTNALTDPAKEALNDINREIEKHTKEISRKQDLIIRAKREGITDLIPKFEAEINDLQKLVLRKKEEADKLSQQITKVESTVVADLFSMNPEPAPETKIQEPKANSQPPKANLKKLKLKAKAIKIKLMLLQAGKSKPKVKAEEKTDELIYNHAKFGKGKVISEDEKTIVLDFGGDIGKKSLLKQFAPLTLISGEPKFAMPKPFKSEKQEPLNRIKNIPKPQPPKAKSQPQKAKSQKPKAKNQQPTPNIQVLKESAKGALLITDGQKTAWIKGNWKREDGSFTPAALKALNNSSDTLARHKGEEFEKVEVCQLVRETEKANLYKVKLIGEYTKIEKYEEFWVPKSKLKTENGVLYIESKFWEQKEKEINSKSDDVLFMPNNYSESEKAYYIGVSIYEVISEQSVRRRMFFPKSVAKVVNDYLLVPMWLWMKKVEETKESAEQGSFRANNFELEHNGEVENYEIVTC
jgi:hypothetical protein